MKRFFTIVLFLVTVSGYSQIRREEKDFALELSGGFLETRDYVARPIAGFTMSYYLGRRVSIDSRFGIGENYLHFSPSLLTAPLFIYTGALKYSSLVISNDLIGNLLLIASAFENTAFHFYFRDKADISPYISLLSFKAIRDDDELNLDSQRSIWRHLRAAGTVGIKFNLYTRKRIYVSPFAEVTMQYSSDGTWGSTIGANIGYVFP